LDAREQLVGSDQSAARSWLGRPQVAVGGAVAAVLLCVAVWFAKVTAVAYAEW
jgi:Protein of unknown function (DUF2384)